MVGLAITTIAFFMFALVPLTPGASGVLIALAVLGLGNGLFIPPNVSAMMGSVPANRRGIASAFRFTLSNIGDTAGFGIAVLIMTIAYPVQHIESAGAGLFCFWTYSGKAGIYSWLSTCGNSTRKYQWPSYSAGFMDEQKVSCP